LNAIKLRGSKEVSAIENQAVSCKKWRSEAGQSHYRIRWRSPRL